MELQKDIKANNTLTIRETSEREKNTLQNFIIYSIVMFIVSIGVFFASQNYFFQSQDPDKRTRNAAFATIGCVNLFLIIYAVIALNSKDEPEPPVQRVVKRE
ncbi:MAG: hypothetical protein EZS28_034840 [Streblomastix strix]|uniref:Vacuolar ATPase assembly integral membrane protein VMA21 n=1 Tax=Streblomastix strix TaxID=222440 RepID=A0A5J4UHH4_9EUKA|nr:MAG: hypothetical protein EZS28_034840 [Streblomastix strix]